MSQRRPWLAALLSFIYPGAGHVYLRAWGRALAWFALAMLTAAVIIPENVLQAGEQGGFRAFYDAFVGLDPMTILPLFIVNGLNVVDAYLSARRANRRHQASTLLPGRGNSSNEEPAPAATDAHPTPGDCPNCGRELDADLDFCPWCTTRLDGGEGSDEDQSNAR
ncbi:MAG: hypothetical protein ABEJ35_00610 [Halobacteriaceae archaeon]